MRTNSTLLDGVNIPNLAETYVATDHPYGLTYGQWTVLWWKWATSIPKARNPVLDRTGIYANINQPEKVWFLAGVFGSEGKDFPRRRCAIPSSKSILLPVINCEANSIEYPDLRTESDLLNHVSEDIRNITRKDCFVNGERLLPERVSSDPKIFSLSISDDLEGLDKGHQNIPCVADGYWVFLKPLSPGQYVFEFNGSCENGRLSSGACYYITVN